MYAKQTNGTVILILGIASICSILCCGLTGLALGIVSWVMGNSALKEIDSGQADPTQRGQVVGGRVCGIIGTSLSGLTTIATIFYYVAEYYTGYFKGITSP